MWFLNRKKNYVEVSFEEILLDSSNLPAFNQGRMEGRIELPITRRNIYYVGTFFVIVALLFLVKLFTLQVVAGDEYLKISENNSIDKNVIIAERGVIYDRNGEMLAWNAQDKKHKFSFPMRAYSDRDGLGQLVGYVSYPQKDAKGFYYRTEYEGISGVESSFNDLLQGQNGNQVLEENALGEVIGEHIVNPPQAGEAVTLSLDAELSEVMFDIIATSTAQANFRSGAGAIMDIHTGEIIALASFPSYDPEVMADGQDSDLIASYNNDDRYPFLNKVLGGVYTPGSVMKPFLAYAALKEGIISPDKVIVSTGEILVPNIYHPSNPTRFRDWRAHGKMTMREAIAFSSNVYFYYISGGYRDQPGLGITKMDEYYDLFGFGQPTGINLDNEQIGTVPSPAWKQENFNDDWRLGDTYLTSIGQFGWQVTPLQILRAYAAIANGGTLVTPQILYGAEGDTKDLNLDQDKLRVVKEGMRMTVNYPGGTARPLERKDVAIAAKSGTAEIGAGNAYVNSWVAGYFPYEEPKYSYVLMMDKAPRSNALGATRIMGDVVEWMSVNKREYLGLPPLE
ncbi:hypothetical protein KC845_03565 [Candidatus Kaiserbacteria bacterium]|nr:hypothetical protein [Candidatus Kaiserbacteria bacterium]